MKKAIIIGMSNGKTIQQQAKIQQVVAQIERLGIFSEVIVDQSVYLDPITNQTLAAKERANRLMNYLLDEQVTAIFDVSGGDMANTILPYLDVTRLATTKAHFFGYSDLSVLLNVLATHTQCTVWNFPVMTIIGPHRNQQLARLKTALTTEYQGPKILGGNIRCTLKLAGTPYCPDFTNHTLLIEAFNGSYEKVMSMLAHYELLGTFEQVNEVLVGCFTELEKAGQKDLVLAHLQELSEKYKFHLSETNQVGHIPSSIPVLYAHSISRVL